jgi:hypothetical protein
VIKQEEEIKEFKIQKEEFKLSLCTNDMILYLKDPEDSAKILLDLLDIFGKIAGYKINKQKSVTFYILTMNRLRKKLEKQFHSQ